MLLSKRPASRGKRNLLVLHQRKNARQKFLMIELLLTIQLFGPAAGRGIESTMVSALSMHCCCIKYIKASPRLDRGGAQGGGSTVVHRGPVGGGEIYGVLAQERRRG